MKKVSITNQGDGDKQPISTIGACLLRCKRSSRDVTVTEELVFRVLLEHGILEVLNYDQGTEFKNLMMQKISLYFGTTQRFTLTNSPHLNNLERLHKMLEKLVRMLQLKQLKVQREWNKLLIMASHMVNNLMCTATVPWERREDSLGHAVP